MITNNPEAIILHHSASKDHPTLDFTGLVNWHVSRNGWKDIGYHYVIDNIWDRYTVIMGRMPYRKGAHCPGMNDKSLGICFVGNFEKNIVPAGQWRVGLDLVGYLLRQYKLSPSDVYGHKNYKNTKCPGKYFDIEEFKSCL